MNEIVKSSNDIDLPIENFKEVIEIIRRNRNELLRTINVNLIDTYWQVGKYISDKIALSAWGTGIVKQLATYIVHNAPELKGFSKERKYEVSLGVFGIIKNFSSYKSDAQIQYYALKNQIS